MLETATSRHPGPWPAAFPVLVNENVREGLIVRSLSGAIEGRTTGARRPCISRGCPGWFVTVRWETGQLMHICSQGWQYDPMSASIRITGGGEVSARVVSPKPLGTPPAPRENWPSREVLDRWAGWR
ncbi:MAG: hypothetical protein ABI658_11665 [Acidimicrobiales bacterium]